MATSPQAAIDAAKKARKAFLISQWDAKHIANVLRDALDVANAITEAGFGNGNPDKLADEKEALTSFLRELEERWSV